jgi:2,3-diketo-5-methylthio-1-phosphopentane phosphatase
MLRAFLCDFDGTISPSDVGASLVRRFTTRLSVLPPLLQRWRQGEIGSREVTEAECSTLAVSEAEALGFARAFALDPYFPAFVQESGRCGDEVMVVSDGFDFYIHELLARHGLEALPRAANRARFEGERLVPEFPFAGTGCGRCGNCKAQHVESFRARGYHTVMVGDGLSDRCAARVADTVLARGELLAWCREEGIAAHPFESFVEVADIARGLDHGAAKRS